jgi:hypothetical protein
MPLENSDSHCGITDGVSSFASALGGYCLASFVSAVLSFLNGRHTRLADG